MRHRILKMLMEEKGYLSGEEMARQLGISRTGVWKHIDALKEMGCKLECRPNKGYKLLALPDLLMPEIVNAQAEAGAWDIRYFQQVESTNETAKAMADKGNAHGTVVVSERQTRGKGRMARQWYAEPNAGIYCSILLRPHMKPQDASKLSLIAGLAVQRTLQAYIQQPVQLKWPNDVVCEGKKLCGILCEMDAEPDAVRYVIVGIGINVNVPEFPQELHDTATSLQLLNGKSTMRAPIFVSLLNHFFALYDTYQKTGNFHEVMYAYSQASALLGKEIMVTAWDETQTGVCLGFDKDGALVLERENGTRVRVLSGDVSIRRRDKAYV